VDGFRRPLPVVVVTGATVAYAWWTAGLRPFTRPALLAVGAAGMAAIAVGTRRRAPSASGRHDARRALPWGLLCAVLAGWEVAAYLQHPRADHPTLSALADQVLDWRPARALAFLVWLVVGADLARR
jgi:hypothetical protein